MTRSRGFARVSLSSARWLLPRIAVLLVSATMAYAITSALHRGASASDEQLAVQATVSTGELTASGALTQSTTSPPATSPGGLAERHREPTGSPAIR
jgi:hypothetical protein